MCAYVIMSSLIFILNPIGCYDFPSHTPTFGHCSYFQKNFTDIDDISVWMSLDICIAESKIITMVMTFYVHF